MARTIYALLVGINEYLGGVPRLNGCTNDVEGLRAFLEARTQSGEFELKLLTLTSGDFFNPDEVKPTRAAVISAFREHLGKAQADDVALFYYSGHGSQELAPPEFWHLEPDHLDETLVLYDSRTEDGWDLADKELALLIAELAARGPHVLVILDACHSGSGTRAADGTTVRLAPLDRRERPLEAFLPGVVPGIGTGAPDTGNLPTPGSRESGQRKTGGWFGLPPGRHVVISACQAEESAREKLMPGGQVHGVLSYYLLDTLQRAGPPLTYRDVFYRLDALVRNLVSDQNPLLAASDSADLQQPFLGGAMDEQLPYYNISFEKESGWTLQAGAIHGIAAPDGAETTHLALFPFGTPLKPGSSLAGSLGQARVLAVQAGQSRVELALADGHQPNPQSDSFRAVVVAAPLSPVAAHLSGGDGPALERLGAHLAGSLIVRPVETAEAAVIAVTAELDQPVYTLKRAGDLQPLRVAVPGKGTEASALEAFYKLEHIARWMQVLALENKASQLPAGAVHMEFFRYLPGEGGGPGHSEPLEGQGAIELEYDPQQGEKSARLQIRLTHTGQYPGRLYCMLVDLTEDFSIAADSALFGGGLWLSPGQEQWATNANGEPFIHVWVPKALQAQGVNQVRDVLKLIVSTDRSDANLLKQDGLELVKDAASRGLERGAGAAAPPSSLHRLLQRVQTRAMGAIPEDEAALSDWRTLQVTVTTRVRSAGIEVPAPGMTAELAGGVRLEGHPGLHARARLAHFNEGKRELGSLALPAVFRQQPELAPPFEFLPGRGDAGASVLVLSEVSDPAAVTSAVPLVLRTDTPLAVDEAILPVAYDLDTELFLPLGLGIPTARGVEIRIERLPAATADSRSVGGAIKLFFQKVKVEKLGLAGQATHRLAAASLNAAGQVEYDADAASVRKKVKRAGRILLFIHGFTGDTLGMVAGAYGLPASPPAPLERLVDHYDLLLAFDYENIHTPVEETAARLKAALAGAGLGPRHRKQLDIVAHSLGTQVARWFIEREGGRKVVHKAILAGPPNNGTPWATIQEYALFGLTAALNGLAAVLLPASAIPFLVSTLAGLARGFEKIDTTLDQLKPGSPFYQALNASEDPRLPYVVIAGDTFKAAAQPVHAIAARGLLPKLAGRLASPATRNRLLSLAFFDAPNDMAIGLSSMAALPPERQPSSRLVEVACDHISYFNTEVGLRAIVEALAGN